MIEITPEALNRLILAAYREGRSQHLSDVSPTPPPVNETPRWEASTAFRDRMAADVVKTFWACLPEKELKWSALSYRAKNEITDTITSAVKVHLLAHFGGRP